MKRILRGLTWLEQSEKPGTKANFKFVDSDRLTNLRQAEKRVLEDVLEFYQQHAEAPSLQVLFSDYQRANLAEEPVLVEELTAETFVDGASYEDSFEKEVEEQAAQLLRTTCRTAVEIATQGKKVGKETLKGTIDAVSYLFSSVQPAPGKNKGTISHKLSENAQALGDLYAERKKNPHSTYGVLTGYGLFDAATAGIRKKQLYLHAGFGGHLKSTHMMNMMVNACVDGGWNILLFTSEMPAPDVQQMLVAIHSANPKFANVGPPIPVFQLLLGSLSDPEEQFYRDVMDDLINNPDHGSIRVVDSGQFTGFASIQQRTIRENAEEEVDQLWIDYLTRLPLDAKYRGLDVTTGRNETIADSKRFAMSFNGGQGLAVCTPFQINREGFKRASQNEGRMDLTALAQYNAAEREADVITYVFFGEEQKATSEPLIGLLKSRWGKVSADPIPVFVEPDSRRIFDLSAGMGPATGYAPTSGGADEGVEL